MIPGQMCNYRIPSVSTSVISFVMTIVFTLLFTATAFETSCAEEYADEAISNPEIGLFFSISDAIAFHERILNARYYLFEPGNIAIEDSSTSAIFPQNGKIMKDFQWVFNRFNSKSKGLVILPVLTNGVHISYKLDF